MLVDIVHAFEFGAYIDGPRERTNRYFELGFELVENFKRVAAFAVELVDEYNHRGIAHAAYLHKLPGLGFDAFGNVYHYYNAVDCRKCAVCVFGEVLMAGGIENVDFVVTVVESHYGGCHGYAALLLYLHPVAGGGLLYLVRFHGSRNVDSSAE